MHCHGPVRPVGYVSAVSAPSLLVNASSNPCEMVCLVPYMVRSLMHTPYRCQDPHTSADCSLLSGSTPGGKSPN
jgi:hypothetical protein